MKLRHVLLLMLAGCATQPAPSPDESATVGSIVESAVDAMQSPAGAQRRRLASAQESHASRPDDASGVRVAVLLATLPEPLRDEAQALALLEHVAARRPASPLTRFAALLKEQVGARQRAGQELASVQRRHEDALRAGEQREEALRKRVEASRSAEQREAVLLRRQTEALRAAELREEILRRQIESLRAAERGIIEREERLGQRPK